MFCKLKIKTNNVKAFNSYIVYGIPSINSFFGFVDAMNYNLKNIKTNINDGLIITIHQMEIFGKYKNDYSFKKSTNRFNNGKMSTIIDTPVLNILEFTLIFNVFDDIDIDMFEKQIRKMRFMNGIITDFSIEIDENIEKLINNTDIGFVLYEEEDKQKLSLDEKIKLSIFNKNFSIMNIGYKLINKLTNLDGVRNDFDFANAEAIHNIVTFKLNKSRDFNKENIIWKSDFIKEKNIFLYSTIN